ncbi:hypothetical protein HGM15179_009007 [Zosterops borbonicus]|uniref:Uncharacterized protein n=1 Tax=Zosterops borbonicus TaxID=364589 RepID=A0A8K1GHZ5_9PASS|nr:hypothetical protein HGM15179_009007 [Zosterops borbonicus]
MEPAALERFHSPGKGNGLRSRRRVRPGELLYRGVPFAYIVSKEQLGSVCERCLRRGSHLVSELLRFWLDTENCKIRTNKQREKTENQDLETPHSRTELSTEHRDTESDSRP